MMTHGRPADEGYAIAYIQQPAFEQLA